MLVGIVGKIEDGRQLVTQIFNETNKYEVINIDKVYFELVNKKEIKEEIKRVLNYNKDNDVNFYLMLYTDVEKRKIYNTFIWNYIEKELDEMINRSQKPIIIEWDKLPLTKFYDLCDIRILVDFNRSLKESFKNIIPMQYQKSKNSFKTDKTEIMKHLFYDGLTDLYIDYKDEDMNYIIDDAFIRDDKSINKDKVKVLIKND